MATDSPPAIEKCKSRFCSLVSRSGQNVTKI